jgi:predicted phosphoribosyltransferase
MPCAFDLGAAIGDDAAEHRERPRVEAAIVRHIHFGLKPELGFGAVLEHVDVDRLERIAFVGIEEEAIAVVAKDDGHHMLRRL